MKTILVKDEANNFSVIKTNNNRSDFVAFVPEYFTKEDYPYLYGEQITDPITGALVWDVKLDDVAKGNEIIKKQTEDQKIALRASYIADIDAEMTRIFGTVDRDKANALYNTWYEFLKDPAYFANKGLLDDQGLPLDTASKVTAFAQAKVNECKDYAVFLINREKQYLDAKAAL